MTMLKKIDEHYWTYPVEYEYIYNE